MSRVAPSAKPFSKMFESSRLTRRLCKAAEPITPRPAKVAQTVSLQLAPEQVKKIAVAKHLGTLSLAMRSAVELRDTADSRTISSCDVSPEIARQNAIAGQSAAVVVYGRR